MKRLYINEREYVTFAEDKIQSLSSEIASRTRAYDFYSLGMYLPDPDPVLKNQGKDIKIYRELLSDAHVWACVQSLKSGVLSLEWDIDRGKAQTTQSKIIERLFKEDLDIYKIISEMTDAVLWGFQPLEISWQKTGSYWLPADVVAKPPEWFVFDEENKLKFRTKENWNGESLPERKFLCPQYNASYNNPYGERVLSRVFWPVTFKKGGLKFWLMFAEKYGMPHIVIKHPRNTKQEEIDGLVNKVEDMVQDAILAIPDDDSIDIKDSAVKTSSSSIYQDIINVSNTEISKAILGQTLSTEIGAVGSFAASQSHMGVRQDFIDGVKKMVMNSCNQLIKWIDYFNFKSQVPPRFIMWHEDDVDKDLAERDKILSEAGVGFTKSYFVREYGFEENDLDIKPQQPALTQFSDVGRFTESTIYNDQLLLDNALDSISDEEMQKQMETILKPVFKLMQNSNNYNEAMEKLIELFPKMKTKQLEDLMARAMFTAHTWGRLNIK